MKVLHVIDALGVGGGAEHSLAAMLPLLRERGIDSSVVCLIARKGGLQEKLRNQGFDVQTLPANTSLGRVLALRRAIKAASPDIVHATLYNSCVTTRFASIGLHVARIDSLVNTSYDPVRTGALQIPTWKLRAVRMLDSLTARHLGRYFHAVTKAVATEATDILGIASNRVIVIPRGRSSATVGERTEIRRKRTRQLLGIANDRPMLLNVGRQDQQKAQADLIRAFAEVKSKYPDAILLIAGREGDASDEVNRALEETGLGDGSVLLLGHRTDVFDLYAASDLFVFPSLYEGIGGALLEAFALGTPIVGSDAPGVAEVLEHGNLGMVTPRGQTATLARAMISMLADPALRQKYAERGRARFLQTYEIERVADAMAAMYRGILDKAVSER